MNEKELTNVPGLKEDEKVIIKKLGFGSLTMLRSNSAKAAVDVKSNNVNASIDMGEYQKWLVALGTKEAPFFGMAKTINDRIRIIDKDGVPARTGEYLYREIQIFNGFEEVNDIKKE